PEDLTKAIELYNLALASNIKTYGESHPNVATTRNNLASALQARNQSRDLSKAIELYELSLETMRRVLSADHPNTKIIAGNLKRAKAKQHSRNKNKS
ncbi:tetratricopeptide repeat protein, partial [Bathymodiolus thermophilus thioautotrophic gill symbiont]